MKAQNKARSAKLGGDRRNGVARKPPLLGCLSACRRPDETPCGEPPQIHGRRHNKQGANGNEFYAIGAHAHGEGGESELPAGPLPWTSGPPNLHRAS